MTALDLRLRAGFAARGIPNELIDELLDSFVYTKRRFYQNDLRPSVIEGARFSEVVFRILQWETKAKYQAMGKTLPKVDALLVDLANATGHDSVRLHIPRTLRLIYDIRNKRNIAHLGDGIDPNVQDAVLVVRNMEWVLAELVRLYHNVSPTEAHAIIVDLVSKDVPVIQVFNGFPRILKNLKASDYLLVLLYWCGSTGASVNELRAWLPRAMRSNMIRTLNALDGKNLIHLDGKKYLLTHLGVRDVEIRKILEPL